MITGKVLSVETRNLAEPTTAAATAGATVIYVNDAASFDEYGGVVTIGGVQFNYTSADAENDSLTLADPLVADLEEQSLIEYYPPLPVKTALVDIGEDGDPVQATVPHSLLDKFGDGVRIDALAESVTLERRGAFEFVIADAVAEPLTQQSLDYVEGEGGYGLSEAVVQVEDIQATGTLGAAAGSFATLSLAGADLGAHISALPRGCVIDAYRGGIGTPNAGPVAGTALRVFELNCGTLYAGRLYRSHMHGFFTATVASDAFDFVLTWTQDGTAATTASPDIPGGTHRFTPGVTSSDFEWTTEFHVDTDCQVRICLYLVRASGSGTGSINLQNPPRRQFEWTIDDAGLATAAQDQTVLSQTLKSDGSGSDNPPVAQFVKTFDATWAQSYSPGGDAYANHGSSDTLWAGYDSSLAAPVAAFDDPDLSLIGFNYTAIAAALALSSTMQKCELLYRGRYRKVSTGLDLKFLTHDYSAWPGQFIDAYNVPSVPNTHITFLSTAQTNVANGANYAIDLGATVGNQLKTSTRRGVGIIGQDLGDDSRGYIYGMGATYKPKLRFTYLGTG